MSTDNFYCVYQNKEICRSELTKEHIIPLSLGGNNQFAIDVSKSKNSEYGTYVDGELTKDPLITLLRVNTNLVGHSRKPAKLSIKKAWIKEGKIPVQLQVDATGLSVYSLFEKMQLSMVEMVGNTVTTVVSYNAMARLVFVAKALLASGYFIYGRTFVNAADHHSLRTLANYRKGNSFTSIKDLPIQVTDGMFGLKPEHGITESEAICSALGSASVYFKLGNQEIRGVVGVGRKFLGSITFKAETSKLPNSGEYRQGHIVSTYHNGMLLMSFKEMADLLYSRNGSSESCYGSLH